jgi:hypothetical protein
MIVLLRRSRESSSNMTSLFSVTPATCHPPSTGRFAKVFGLKSRTMWSKIAEYEGVIGKLETNVIESRLDAVISYSP